MLTEKNGSGDGMVNCPHLLLSLRDLSFHRLRLPDCLSSTAECVHHHRHHILVDTQDADQVRVLEEDVVVHEGPEKILKIKDTSLTDVLSHIWLKYCYMALQYIPNYGS